MRGDDAAVLRGLELTVIGRLDGLLQGDYLGLLPGHGSEAGEAREYAPGDDVRRIDWNVTARTAHPHVRDTIVDRELETTVVADLSGSMSFGTAEREKRELALAAAAAVGFLVARGGNRVGALVLAGEQEAWVPAGRGRLHLYRLLRTLQRSPTDAGPADLERGLRSVARLARRRGLVVVISDFLAAEGWQRPLRAVARRHDTLAVEVLDPRELELPDVGFLTLVDPETGRRRRFDTSRPRLRTAYARAAAEQREQIRRSLRSAGVDHMQLRTDRDWVLDLVAHVRRRRHVLAAARRGRP